MNFKIGQKVVCVEPAPSQPLIKGQTYIVDHTSYCECEKQRIEIGISATRATTRCACCGSISPSGTYWRFNSFRFAPLEYNTAHDEIIEKYPLTEEVPDTPIKEPQI